jgi:hypothetical protein
VSNSAVDQNVIVRCALHMPRTRVTCTMRGAVQQPNIATGTRSSLVRGRRKAESDSDRSWKVFGAEVDDFRPAAWSSDQEGRDARREIVDAEGARGFSAELCGRREHADDRARSASGTSNPGKSARLRPDRHGDGARRPASTARHGGLGFEERPALLLDRETMERENKRWTMCSHRSMTAKNYRRATSCCRAAMRASTPPLAWHGCPVVTGNESAGDR